MRSIFLLAYCIVLFFSSATFASERDFKVLTRIKDSKGYYQKPVAYKNFVYVLRGYDTIQALDLTSLTAPKSVWNYEIKVPASGAIGNDDSGFNDLAVVGNTLFAAAGRWSGIMIFSLETPREPTLVGKLELGYCATSVASFGNFLYVADTRRGLRIFDVRNPKNIKEMGGVSYGGGADLVWINGDRLFVRAQPDFRSYETWTIQFSLVDPANPALLMSLAGADSLWSGSIYKHYALIPDSQKRGIRIFNIEKPEEFNEVGFWSVGVSTGVTVRGDFAFVRYMSRVDNRQYQKLLVLDLSASFLSPTGAFMDDADGLKPAFIGNNVGVFGGETLNVIQTP